MASFRVERSGGVAFEAKLSKQQSPQFNLIRMATVCVMDKNEEKLELGSKTEPQLTKNCDMTVDWNGGVGCGTKEIQTQGKLRVLLLYLKELLKR